MFWRMGARLRGRRKMFWRMGARLRGEEEDVLENGGKIEGWGGGGGGRGSVCMNQSLLSFQIFNK